MADHAGLVILDYNATTRCGFKWGCEAVEMCYRDVTASINVDVVSYTVG